MLPCRRVSSAWTSSSAAATFLLAAAAFTSGVCLVMDAAWPAATSWALTPPSPSSHYLKQEEGPSKDVLLLKEDTYSDLTSDNMGDPVTRHAGDFISDIESNFKSDFVAFDSNQTLDLSKMIYVRVPKTGSSSLGALIMAVAEQNDVHWNFRNRYQDGNKMSTPAQRGDFYKNALLPGYHLGKGQVGDSRDSSRGKPDANDYYLGTGLMGHLRFSDFREPASDGRDSPVWISQVRDPADRFISRFFFTRFQRKDRFSQFVRTRGLQKAQEWRNESLEECVLEAREGEEGCYFTPMKDSYEPSPITYFCGYAEWCQLHGSRRALSAAKKHVEMFFPVVGLLEHLNETLLVLERSMPNFLSGLSKAEIPHEKDNHFVKPAISIKVREVLRQTFQLEYELYEFLERRLLTQYHILNASSHQ